jgi:hypothetical protein
MIAPCTWTAAIAASRPTGVSARSTTHARAMYGSCARGEIPRARKSQPAALAKSKTICAPRAGSSTSSAASSGSGRPSATTTSAGPTECHELTRWMNARSGSRRRSWTSRPSTSPAATVSGTSPGGSTNSIGTSTSCVGTAQPVEISNATRDARAYASTSVTTSHAAGASAAGTSTAIASATTRNAPPSPTTVHSRRPPSLEARLARDSSISSATAGST